MLLLVPFYNSIQGFYFKNRNYVFIELLQYGLLLGAACSLSFSHPLLNKYIIPILSVMIYFLIFFLLPLSLGFFF